MCGILGKIDLARPIDRDLFDRQLDSLTARGPDDRGVWLSDDGRIALGSRRLAIQDLSPAGHMPMADPTGKVWITHNGEVYNFLDLRREFADDGYRFQSRSDTELILAAYLRWGEACLSRLDGMFAFAILDTRPDVAPSGRLLLARDRAGEKPLYYARTETGLIFASELKALMVDPSFPRRLDGDAFNALMAFGYVPGRLCILQGVAKLGAAEALSYDLDSGAMKRWRYWSLPESAKPAYGAEGDLLAELDGLLETSVRGRLVADVPVGILLSGGLDSSLVTAIAARCAERPVKTFTIAFPGHGKFDEAPFARKVAAHFGTEHHELAVEPAAVDLLPELARYFDEPFADPSMIPTWLVSRLTRQHVTVALGGDGGDELFAGYDRYRMALEGAALSRYLPGTARRVVATAARRMLPAGVKGRARLMTLAGPAGETLLSRRLVFDANERCALYSKDFAGTLGDSLAAPEAGWRDQADDEAGLLDRMTRLDFATYLPDDILTKVDRASMAHGLEMRAPWLDHRLVEFAYRRVPPSLKADRRRRKILLVKLARRLLPADLEVERKQGFSPPLASWLAGPFGAMVCDILAGADAQLFRPEALKRLQDRQRRGHSHTGRLFLLTMFELWRRHYGVEFA